MENSKPNSNNKKFRDLVPYLLVGLALIAAYRISGHMVIFADALRWVWGVMRPFFFGFMLAYIINMPMSGVQRLLSKSKNKFIRKRQRLLGVLSVTLIFLAIIGVTLSFIIPAIGRSITMLIENAETYLAAITGFVDWINNLELFGLNLDLDADFFINLLGTLFADFDIEAFLRPIIGAGTAIFTGVIAFIASIYILVEKNRFKRYLNKLMRIFLSNNTITTITTIAGGLNNNFRTYIRTQTIDGLILGTMATIILFILGSDFALILGIMLGIVNYIPYFGSIFGTLVAVLVVIFTQDFTTGVIAAIALFIAQQIDANIIQPRLMSGSFALSPLLVIIGISVGGAIAGIMGMIVAIPILAMLKDIFDSVVDYYENAKLIRSREAKPGE